MKTVSKLVYEADNGTQWETEADAVLHDKILTSVSRLAPLLGTVKPERGDEYVEHNGLLIREARRLFAEEMVRLGQLNPRNLPADGLYYGGSLADRIISESKHFRAFRTFECRLASTSLTHREYEQPYFAQQDIYGSFKRLVSNGRPL